MKATKLSTVEEKRCRSSRRCCRDGKPAFNVVGESGVIPFRMVEAAKHVDDAALIHHASRTANSIPLPICRETANQAIVVRKN